MSFKRDLLYMTTFKCTSTIVLSLDIDVLHFDGLTLFGFSFVSSYFVKNFLVI